MKINNNLSVFLLALYLYTVSGVSQALLVKGGSFDVFTSKQSHLRYSVSNDAQEGMVISIQLLEANEEDDIGIVHHLAQWQRHGVLFSYQVKGRYLIYSYQDARGNLLGEVRYLLPDGVTVSGLHWMPQVIGGQQPHNLLALNPLQADILSFNSQLLNGLIHGSHTLVSMASSMGSGNQQLTPVTEENPQGVITMQLATMAESFQFSQNGTFATFTEGMLSAAMGEGLTVILSAEVFSTFAEIEATPLEQTDALHPDGPGLIAAAQVVQNDIHQLLFHRYTQLTACVLITAYYYLLLISH